MRERDWWDREREAMIESESHDLLELLLQGKLRRKSLKREREIV